ncbi:MAG: tetratricopeptide repeat protein [Bacteroidia bacterium]
MQDLNAVISIRPNFAPAYNNRGMIHFSNQNNVAALEDFEKSLKLAPDYVEPLMNRRTDSPQQRKG